ncbi:MAG: sensor histidine kinase [Lachnospiraceae bacterium]|nr:sensor histidine kinase [Lachnospiraceae bacterium]MCI9590456.1 sensor histidine kinase [Lachnospiraceae bacterium]
MENRSYIRQLFHIMGGIVTAAVLLIGCVIFFYAKAELEEEMFLLNKNLLNQIGQVTKIRLTEYNYLSDKIASNSEMITLLASQDREESAVVDTIQKLLDNYVWTYSNFNPLVYTYVVANDGTVYTDSMTKKDGFALLRQYIEKESEWDWKEDVRFLGPLKNEDAKGIYKYTFLIVRKIKDHLSGETLGAVVLNISEKNLYESYRNLIDKEKNFYVTDKDGIIISEKRKLKIGQFCGISVEGIQEKEEGRLIVENGDTKAYFLYDEIPGTGWYLIETIHTSGMLASLKKIGFFIVIIITGAIILLWNMLRICQKRLLKPVMEIKEKMGEVSKGNMLVRLDYKENNEFGEMSQAFNCMVERLEESREQIKEGEKKKRLAELDFLRAQINPHFIYNTLSSIRFFVEMKKNQEAEDMLLHFSKILRKSLSYSNEFVALKTELETIKEYVELQKMRYQNAFQVDCQVPEEILENRIPVFILQPIVENAIFHGMMPGQICQITISAYEKEGKLFLLIADNGRGIKAGELPDNFEKAGHMSRVGIQNVHDRIQMNFGREFGLKVNSTEGEGTTATFILPVNKEGRDQ